jgi:two-component system, NarL family, nitrate/nitrite response regulator NarL
MEVLELATSAHQGMETARRERPNVVLLDLGLPDMGGIEAGKKILEDLPEAKIIAVTGLNDSRAARDALRAGFQGYLTKDTPLVQFVGAIQTILDGQVVMPRNLAPGAAGAQSPEERAAALLIAQLTPREREVLALLAEGVNSKTICARLGVSSNTVRTHVQNILTKLQVHSRLEAATFGVRLGIVRLPGERREA